MTVKRDIIIMNQSPNEIFESFNDQVALGFPKDLSLYFAIMKVNKNIKWDIEFGLTSIPLACSSFSALKFNFNPDSS